MSNAAQGQHPEPILGTRIGPYQIVRAIAEGGMAEVYQCVRRGPQGFEKQLVLKVLHSRWVGVPEYERMFLEEAKVLAQLQHPNIVQAFEYEVMGRVPFLVMEYINGPTLGMLQSHASNAPVYQPGYLLHAVMQICQGLDYAHRFHVDGSPYGLVHRDVSSHNILIDASTGVAKLIDFGIARYDGDRQPTRSGVLKGKLSYMAPEILAGQRPDGRADIFAVGVLLYRIATRRMPFSGPDVMPDLIAGRYPPASSLAPVPRNLEAIIDRTLLGDPDQRYQTAGALAADLEDELNRMGVDPKRFPNWIHEVFPAKDWTETPDVATLHFALRRMRTDPGASPPPAPPYGLMLFVAVIGSAALLVSMIAAVLALTGLLVFNLTRDRQAMIPDAPTVEQVAALE